MKFSQLKWFVQRFIVQKILQNWKWQVTNNEVYFKWLKSSKTLSIAWMVINNRQHILMTEWNLCWNRIIDWNHRMWWKKKEKRKMTKWTDYLNTENENKCTSRNSMHQMKNDDRTRKTTMAIREYAIRNTHKKKYNQHSRVNDTIFIASLFWMNQNAKAGNVSFR